MASDKRIQAVGIAIYEARPRIVFCGHLHMSPYTVYKYEYGTLYVRIDSSQKHMAYAMLHIDDMKIEVLRDHELVEKVMGRGFTVLAICIIVGQEVDQLS